MSKRAPISISHDDAPELPTPQASHAVISRDKKNMLRKLVRHTLRRVFSGTEHGVLSGTQKLLVKHTRTYARTSPEVKVGQRLLYSHYRAVITAGSAPALHETGFRVFSQCEEDGKLLFIAAVLGIPRGTFVEIGGSDGINSNCANLALNHGWHGTFIDGDEEGIRRGEAFYSDHPDTRLFPPTFVNAWLTSENINETLEKARVPGEVDLMSIDIDGNDYWIWEAIDYCRPKIVVIEAHPEFGDRSIVVPYKADYVYPGHHPDYLGASPAALAKLGARKGYRLVGSNEYGFNLIFVKNDLAAGVLPEVSVQSILDHPRNVERALLFESIKDLDYVQV